MWEIRTKLDLISYALAEESPQALNADKSTHILVNSMCTAAETGSVSVAFMDVSYNHTKDRINTQGN